MVDLSKFRKQYKRRGPAIPAEPAVSLGSTGVLLINEPAWQLFGEPSPDAVVVYYNDGEQVVALQASTRDDSDAFRVHKQGRSYQVNARRFVQESGIEPGLAKIGEPHFDKKNKALYFTIDQDGQTGSL